MNDITKVSGAIGRVSDVPNILARLKNLYPNEESLIENAVRILDKIEFNNESSSDARFQVATFAAEQLRLSLVNPHHRRYSSKLMSLAMVWDRTSPKLYNDLYASGLFCLPSNQTVRRLTSALSVRGGLEDGTVQYLKMTISKLEQRDKLVNLAMDEVYTAKAIEFAGGRVYGESELKVTQTLFSTLISSVGGSYQDFVSMTPIVTITSEGIKEIFDQVVQGLTDVGFVVVSVTTDGHKTNVRFHNEQGSICNPLYTVSH